MGRICVICKKDTKVYNVLDSFEGRCVKVDLEGYFGVDSHVIKRGLKEEDCFCKSCIISLRNLTELNFNIEKIIFERGEKGITLNINLPGAENVNTDDNSDDNNLDNNTPNSPDELCDKELLRIEESRELHNGTLLENNKPVKVRSSSAIELREMNKEIPCGFSGCTFSYHSVVLINKHRQLKHNQIPLYSCTECSVTQKFATNQDLQMHLANEHLEERICPFCKPGIKMETFSGIKKLNEHIYKVHITAEKNRLKSAKRKTMFVRKEYRFK